ncbi:type II toxin-antitoxin system PemK/MazF family toxin [bacterium]|nr:type II toxin-antitoxin system PemK/MazF family toxin [bacterium]
MWNEIKKDLSQNNHKTPFYKDSDIWWLSIGYNMGCEVYGKGKDYARPVLVIKKFNQYSFIGIPLSTKVKDDKYHTPITVKNKTVSALTSQVRTFSTKRLLYKIIELDEKDYRKVVDNVVALIKLPPSISRGGRG